MLMLMLDIFLLPELQVVILDGYVTLLWGYTPEMLRSPDYSFKRCAPFQFAATVSETVWKYACQRILKLPLLSENKRKN